MTHFGGDVFFNFMIWLPFLPQDYYCILNKYGNAFHWKITNINWLKKPTIPGGGQTLMLTITKSIETGKADSSTDFSPISDTAVANHI